MVLSLQPSDSPPMVFGSPHTPEGMTEPCQDFQPLIGTIGMPMFSHVDPAIVVDDNGVKNNATN